MKKVLFLVGNYGVGKSSLMENPIIERKGLFCRISDDWWILGKNTSGADTVSDTNKEKVMRMVVQFPHNVILGGNYYCQKIDADRLLGKKKMVSVYLKTSFHENLKRVKKRSDKTINLDTYNMKIHQHKGFLKHIKAKAKIYIIDNNRPLSVVKSEFNDILTKEK